MRAKNYLITGFSGFVGRYFFEYLHQTQEKANILGIDITEPSFDFKRCSNLNTKFSKADLLNKNKIRDELGWQPKIPLKKSIADICGFHLWCRNMA